MNLMGTVPQPPPDGGRAGRPVLIADHEAMFAEAFAHLLEAEGYDGVELAGSFECLRRRVGELPARPPALCLVELRGWNERPGAPGQLMALRELSEHALVVVVTGDRDPRARARTLATGIRAFLTKDQPASRVLAALDRVCDPQAPRPGIDPLLGFVAGHAPDPAGELLTAREREVLQALVDGESTPVIAARLGVRPSTLRGYIQRVLMKLGVHSRAAAAAVAVQRGLARPGERRVFSADPLGGDRPAAPR
jgi:two-component system, NarL family, nitrate/nitrite response regulator NarL